MGRVVKGHVVPKVLLDARVEADALLARARAEAAAIRGEAGATREDARREGFAAGRAEGLADAAAALAAAREEAARLVEASRPVALALASKMAERIVGRAVALQPETMAEIAGEALAACRPGAGAARVRVHPDDLAAVEARRGALAERAGAVPLEALEIIGDETVGRHGCVIETPRGIVDARLATQLAALERAVAETMTETARG
ncbi:MAG TPA: FliH/SctL family protein [Polyangia bacterium]|nr:FliH/SctL family protein [Polyangia bacterium]